MSDVIYTPLIDDMTWSYSRIGCFDNCPYAFFLKYIHGDKDEPKFYASYGSFMHKLIEEFYKGEISKEEMLTKFLTDFQTEVKGKRPARKIVENYIKKGVKYLEKFTPFKYEMVGVEKKVEFEIGGRKFIGFIDYLGKDGDDFVVIDNKSRDLKPRSKRKTPTVKDKELDSMLKQLYIYSTAVKQEYGKFPTKLCFNCFKNGEFIEEEFSEEAYNEAIKWAEKSIESIRVEEDFDPEYDYFFCSNICGVSYDCTYYEMETEDKKKGW